MAKSEKYIKQCYKGEVIQTVMSKHWQEKQCYRYGEIHIIMCYSRCVHAMIANVMCS